MNLPVIVLASGGHAKVLISTLLLNAAPIIGIVERAEIKIGEKVLGIDVIGDDESILQRDPSSVLLVNGLGSSSSTKERTLLYQRFRAMGYVFCSVIHPSAVIAGDVILGQGVQIMAGAVIQPGCRIGDNVIINTGACVDHDCRIGDHAHIAPGTVLAGEVVIGSMSFVGASASVVNGLTIGDSAVVGAGSVVVDNIPPGATAFGVPARVVR